MENLQKLHMEDRQLIKSLQLQLKEKEIYPSETTAKTNNHKYLDISDITTENIPSSNHIQAVNS